MKARTDVPSYFFYTFLRSSLEISRFFGVHMPAASDQNSFKSNCQDQVDIWRDSDQASLSIVIPVYNEAENIPRLVAAVHNAMETHAGVWELVIVNDGSTDATWDELKTAQRKYGMHLRIFELNRNFGQTAALQAGLDQARGEIVATMDGDLQNDPKDIAHLTQHLMEQDLDMVSGWRENRQDKALSRRLPSFLANRLIGKVTGVRLRDYGCSLKVYRASVIDRLVLFGDMHRFIPAWVALTTRSSKIQELPVRHHPRIAGESKYNLNRVSAVIIDLISVYFFLRYETRPGHFFGGLGLSLGGIGVGLFSYLASLKIFLGEDIGTRPMLTVATLLCIAGIQLLTVGVLAELMTRTYYRAGQGKSYVIRNLPESAAKGWFQKSD